MKNRIFILSVILVLVSACSFDDDINNTEKINTGLVGESCIKVLVNNYTPAMSSVPGMPFGIKSDTEFSEITWVVTSGSFAIWSEDTDFKVLNKGSEFRASQNDIVYWQPDLLNEIKETEISVKLKVYNSLTRIEKIRIVKTSNGLYSVIK